MYDYGARMLMPDLGRWGAMDAMSEKYSAWSPYNYTVNNPVMVIDPDGNDMHGEAAQQAFKAYVATMSTSNETSGGSSFTGFGRAFGEDPKPGFWGRVSNWWDRWFGKSKKAAIGVVSVGAATFEGLAPPVEFGQTVARWAGYARLGLWSLPLMLNGDSGFSANSKPITGATDISGEISKGDNNRNGILLYRGVSSSSHSEVQATMYNEALFGIAIPNGLRPENIYRAHWDMDDHAMSDNISVWTSWTTNKETARYFARGVSGESEGVILSKRFKIGVNAIPNVSETGKRMQENEWLIFGPVIRANVEHIKP